MLSNELVENVIAIQRKEFDSQAGNKHRPNDYADGYVQACDDILSELTEKIHYVKQKRL